MAVKNSTLKKRIKTMKYHKLHKASFRQSIFFLFLMILGITLPIACSDLRGPEGLSMEQIEQESLKLSAPDILINGVSVINSEELGIGEINAPGLGALTIPTEKYGYFVIALYQFDGSQNAGTLKNNRIKFSINKLDVEIISKDKILSTNASASMWVRHYPDRNSDKKGIGSTINPNKQYGLPSSPSGTNEDDFFVVVEEMPKLKGGMAGIHAKLEYPEMARRAGIEGRVTVQFIVNEQGNVENAEVVRGIGAGCDEQALKVIKEAQFTPGVQRGRPVRVQYALSLNFRLENSEFTAPASPTMSSID
jgi:TonB family protein